MQPGQGITPQIQTSTVSKKDALMAYVLILVKKGIQNKSESELDYLRIKGSIKSIFDSNNSVEEILSELNNFFTQEPMFSIYSQKIFAAIDDYQSKIYT